MHMDVPCHADRGRRYSLRAFSAFFFSRAILCFAVFVASLSCAATRANGQPVQQIGYYSVNGVFSIDAKPGFMMLGTGSLVDISDPTAPVISGSISMQGPGTSVLVKGPLAFIGTGMLVKLVVVDISNPAFPIQVGVRSFPQTSNGIFGMALQDTVLFLALGDAGFYSVDVSDPANPSVLDSIQFPGGQARDVVTGNGFAFIAHTDGMQVVDISDPSNLLFMSDIGSGYYAIDVEDNHIFLGKNGGGVDVYDISSPLFPVPAFSIASGGGNTWDLKAVAGYLYLASNSSGLFVYKIENNSGVLKAAWPNTGNGQSFGVAVQDSLILLSGLVNGVAVLSFDSTGTTGITEKPGWDVIDVYPNPASRFLYLGSRSGPSRVFVLDVTGALVLDQRMPPDASRVSVASLSPGLYTLIVESGDKKQYVRFIRAE